MSALRDHFGAAVPGRTHMALQATLGCLAVLGLLHISEEWSDAIAVWSLGRPPLVAMAPRALVALASLGAFAFGLGWRTRAATAVVCGALALLHAWLPVVYHNNLYLLWLMVLVTGVAGHPDYRLSWLARHHDADPSPHLALMPRLIRWQVAIVYVASVLVKAAHPWWQGTGQVIRWIALERAPAMSNGIVNVPLRPLLRDARVASALDVMVMGAELILPLLLFTPKRRRAGITLGVAMHAFMQEWLFPQLFTFVMLWAYYAFVPAGDRAWRVRYSRAHAFDRALARFYPRVDWLARTHWEPSDERDLVLVSPDGSALRDVRALAMLSVLTPLTLMLWAALSLPAPHARTLFTLPRDAVENVAVLLVASLWIPRLWDPLWRRLRA